ncbi:hypothetical protein EPUL_000893, partial [Erysiphe pulchra]
MATTSNASSIVTETMQRLSSKSSVIATIAIDRKTSTILASSGQTGVFQFSKATTNAPALNSSNGTPPLPTSNVSEFAVKIWDYVNNTSKMILDIDQEDDLKLLRVRTKKYELVIVPDNNYIFVVAHEIRPSVSASRASDGVQESIQQFDLGIPPLAQEFTTRKEMLDSIKAWAISVGFYITINSGGNKDRVSLKCDLGGAYSVWKLTGTGINTSSRLVNYPDIQNNL